jgi:hypothetical protein
MANQLTYVPLDGSYQEAVLDGLEPDNTNDNINTAEIKSLLSKLLIEQKLTNELLQKIYNPQ